MDRRRFLKASTLTAAALAISPESFATSKPSSIAKRPLGKTGERLSIFGFGGTAVMSVEQFAANSLVAEAFDLGVNYYDVSPTYGNAEERLGPALEPYRKRCFLASKTDFRDKAGCEADLNKSLKTLRTDHFDLYQHHAVDKISDLNQIFGPAGAQEALLAAKKAGKIRLLGICTHNVEVALAALDHGGLDTVMFPINYVLFENNFGQQVLKRAAKDGIGIFAIKAMARGKYATNLPDAKRTPKCWYEPCTLPEEATLAFRWTLSQPVTSAIPPGNPDWFRLALRLSQGFKPITEQESKTLLSFKARADALFP